MYCSIFKPDALYRSFVFKLQLMDIDIENWDEAFPLHVMIRNGNHGNAVRTVDCSRHLWLGLNSQAQTADARTPQSSRLQWCYPWIKAFSI